MFQFLIWAITLLLTTCLTEGLDTDLELVQIVFRHGDRTPVIRNYFDTFTDETWSKFGGYGQLTQKGMQTSYEFGKSLRLLYNDFIGTVYDRTKIYTRSTDYDRTIMSAQMLLAGLFRPYDFQVWNKDFEFWQPIPVHSVDIMNDHIFYQDVCPRYEQLKEVVYKSDEFLNKVAENQDLLDTINSAIGGGNLTYPSFERLSDNFYIQKENGMNPPEWVTDSVYERIRLLGRGLYNFYFQETSMARLVSGSILNQLRINIQNKYQNSSTPERLFLYSGHDNYLAGLLKLLNVTKKITQPNYASAIVLELHRSKKNKYYVRALWKDNLNTEPIDFNEMAILKCEKKSMCSLDTFMELTESLVVTDVVDECKLVKHKIQGSSFLMYTLVLLVAVVGCVFSVYSFVLNKYYRKKHAIRRVQIDLSETVNLMISDDELYSNTDQTVFSREATKNH